MENKLKTERLGDSSAPGTETHEGGGGEGEYIVDPSFFIGRKSKNNGDSTQNCNTLPLSTSTGISFAIFRSSLQLRILTVILMQGIGIISLICEAHMLYRDIQWNLVLDGKSAVDFPTSNAASEKKLLHFGEQTGQLRKLLRRDLVLPVMCMIMVTCLLVVNIITQMFDLKRRYLSFAAGLYAFLGASLLTVATIQIVFTQEYISNVYGTVMKTLIDVMPYDLDIIPNRLPDGEPISVLFHAPFFLQVFESCRIGDNRKWLKQSNLMGFNHIRIPSYRQLVQMGFCISDKMIICPMVILVILTVLSWLNVFLCLQIWRRHVVALILQKTSAGTNKDDSDAYMDPKLKRELPVFQNDEDSS